MSGPFDRWPTGDGFEKFWGFVAFAASVAIPFLLPWLDRSPVHSIRYKGPIVKTAIGIFVVVFIIILRVIAPSFFHHRPVGASTISTLIVKMRIPLSSSRWAQYNFYA